LFGLAIKQYHMKGILFIFLKILFNYSFKCHRAAISFFFVTFRYAGHASIYHKERCNFSNLLLLLFLALLGISSHRLNYIFPYITLFLFCVTSLSLSMATKRAALKRPLDKISLSDSLLATYTNI